MTVPSKTLQLVPCPSTSSSSGTSVSSSLMVTFAARNHFPKAINFVFKGSLRFLPPLPTTLAVGVVVALELDLVVAAVARAFDLYFFSYRIHDSNPHRIPPLSIPDPTGITQWLKKQQTKRTINLKHKHTTQNDKQRRLIKLEILNKYPKI